MRAISTVLDASLCLLLVTASALTLAGTPGQQATNPDGADEVAEVLATSTARVEYRTAAGRDRTVHDTLAGLLAAAVARENVDTRQGSTDFVRAVTEKVERALGRADRDVQVVARPKSESAPASGATTEDRVVVGDAPPPEADLHAAGFEVRRVRVTVRTWSA